MHTPPCSFPPPARSADAAYAQLTPIHQSTQENGRRHKSTADYTEARQTTQEHGRLHRSTEQDRTGERQTGPTICVTTNSHYKPHCATRNYDVSRQSRSTISTTHRTLQNTQTHSKTHRTRGSTTEKHRSTAEYTGA